jgi:hypothetical protein
MNTNPKEFEALKNKYLKHNLKSYEIFERWKKRRTN